MCKIKPAIFALLLTLPVFLPAAGIEISGTNFANWFVLGEPAVFKGRKPLPEGAALTAVLFDSNGKELLRQELSAAGFNRDGWSWKAPAPGFYEVEFHVDGKPVTESYPVRIRLQDPFDTRKYTLGGEREFVISRHPFVVAPDKTAAPSDISPNFGVSPHSEMYKNEVPLARLVGFHSIRIHALHWDQLEKEKGKIDWSTVDGFMRLARESGFSDEQITFNIFGTPRWASSRPEADWINICIPEYATVRPKNLDDWRNFLRQVIQRYPKVNRYELWNEPHLVGFSCFWADSTENFVELLKAGYETVKAEKPGAEVWLGGIGMRYLPFYDAFLKAGGGKYYDALSMHLANWGDPEPFHELEKKYGITAKPVVCSEWHAMLLKPMMVEYPSEKLLARDMVLGFLSHIRAGVTEVDFFSMLNWYRVERETLPFYRELRQCDVHVAGLFRQVPYIQPRYQALAWHVLTSRVKGRLKVGTGHLFDGNRQRAVRLDSEAGSILLVWNIGDQPLPLASELALAIGPNSRLLNAEGAVLPPAAFRLAPEEYYYILAPDTAAIAGWRNTGEVLYAQNAKRTLRNDDNGVYRRGKLFDANGDTIAPDKLAWQPVGKRVVCNPGLAPGSIKGRFAAGFTPAGFELLVEVDDPAHVMKTNDMQVWEFDSLQFAFDTKGDGFDTDRMEFASALGEDGKPSLWKVCAPNLGGDLPARFSAAGTPVSNARCRIDRKNGKTVYRIGIDAPELYPFSLEEQPRVRFSLLVNNNDGGGRASWIEWATGIGNVKDPARYGNLTPEQPAGPLAAQPMLKNKGWNRDYSLEFRNRDGMPSVRVGGESKLCAGVSTGEFATVPGAACRVRFEARGDARLQVLASGPGLKRLDLLPPTQLDENWKRFDLPFPIPNGCRKLSVSCFAWQQPGRTFELRNFSVEPL